MDGAQILEDARNNLNALVDTLWSDDELLQSLYRVMLKVARRTRCIEEVSTTTTVAGTDEYAFPTRCMEVVRVTYDGSKLQKIDRREYDSINPSSVSSSGRPSYYLVEDDEIILYPNPDSAVTLKYWTINEPAVPTTTSTLEIPTRYHDVLVDGLTAEMCPKDLGHPLTTFWTGKFNSGIEEIAAHVKQSKRSDRFSIVKTEEEMLTGDFGII